jgi:hypothetical protein
VRLRAGLFADFEVGNRDDIDPQLFGGGVTGILNLRSEDRYDMEQLDIIECGIVPPAFAENVQVHRSTDGAASDWDIEAIMACQGLS